MLQKGRSDLMCDSFVVADRVLVQGLYFYIRCRIDSGGSVKERVGERRQGKSTFRAGGGAKGCFLFQLPAHSELEERFQ